MRVLLIAVVLAGCYDGIGGQRAYPCALDNQCPESPHAWVCVQGTCLASCAADGCDGGEQCVRDPVAAYCAPQCAGTEDCPAGLQCDGGRCSTPRACIPPPSGMVSWWRGEDNELDTLGRNHAELWSKASAFHFVPGVVGKAFALRPGMHDSVEAGTSALPRGVAPRTVEGWIWIQPRLDSDPIYPATAPGQVITINTSSTSIDGITLHTVGTVDRELELGIGVGENAQTRTFSEGAWHHVAFVRTSNAADFYFDGVHAFTSPGTLGVAPTSRVYFGGNHERQYSYVHGAVDEVSLYARALSAEEIAAIYRAGSAGKCVPK